MGKVHPLYSSALFFLSGLTIAFLGYYFSLQDRKKITLKPNILKFIFSGLVFIAGTYLLVQNLGSIFISNPIDQTDVSQSDIIPQIMVMCSRFINGSFPYEAITEWGYTLNPTYLPLQWIPYCIAELLEMDYRWIAAFVFFVAMGFYHYNFANKSRNWAVLVIISILPWIAMWRIFKFEPEVFAYTVENLITGYYLLFGMALLSGKMRWIAITLTLCLLSRYSFILWLPLFAAIYWFEEQKSLIRIVLFSFGALVLIYVLPFLLKSPEIFSASLAHHLKAAVGEWAPYWQSEGEKPYHLFRGIGMASLFYEYAPGEILNQIKLLQRVQLSLLGLSGIASFVFYYKFKNKINLPVFLLSTLCLYFCFFYQFIQIPYAYLMTVPLICNILLFGAITTNIYSKDQ